MRSLRQALEDYLRVRRRLGSQLKTEQPLLESFVEFMEQAGAGRITSELAVTWAMLPRDAHPHRWGQRLSIVRVFARYVATLDPDSEIPLWTCCPRADRGWRHTSTRSRRSPR